MAFTHNTAAVAATDTSSTTANVSVTGVNAGDAVQIIVKWEETGDTTVTVADTGATDNFIAGEKVVHGNGDLCMQSFYLLSATVTGSVTYRATFASARNYKGMACVVVTPDGGETVTLDDSNAGSGSSTSASSGNIVLTGTDISVLAAYGPYSAASTSSHQINGSATGVTVTSAYSYGIAWYARYTSAFTGAATCTLNSSADWVCAAVALKSAAGGSTYTLTCAAGSYSLTGTAATLLFNRVLPVNSGSYSTTGTAAGLIYNRIISCDAGSYALTGTNTGLIFNRALACDPGSYALTGTDAALTYTPSGTTYSLACDAGAYSLTGVSSALQFNRILTCDVGSYALTGTVAEMSRGRTIACEPGSYSVSGIDATFVYNRAMQCDPGAYTFSGIAATLTYSGGGVWTIQGDESTTWAVQSNQSTTWTVQ